MTKLEELNKQISILNTGTRTYTVKLENTIYCIYCNDKYITCGRDTIIDDLLHGFITGFYIGREALYDELKNYLS